MNIIQEQSKERRIFELLQSTNREDVELGVVIAVKEFGEQWCKKKWGWYLSNNGSVDYNWYYIKYEEGWQIIILQFHNCNIFIGKVLCLVDDNYVEMSKNNGRRFLIKDMRE